MKRCLKAIPTQKKKYTNNHKQMNPLQKQFIINPSNITHISYYFTFPRYAASESHQSQALSTKFNWTQSSNQPTAQSQIA